MPPNPQRYTGSCHGGAIRVFLAFTRPAVETQLRTCQCGFCRRQGAAAISDPDGTALWEIDAAPFVPNRFATASSILCGKCGMYAGAVLTDGDQSWSIANTCGLAMETFAGRPGEPMHYEQETPAERIARRKRRWTPTELRITPRAASQVVAKSAQ